MVDVINKDKYRSTQSGWAYSESWEENGFKVRIYRRNSPMNNFFYEVTPPEGGSLIRGQTKTLTEARGRVVGLVGG